ncbi:carboxymuconolactone decarboxylase family protein [Pseudonocardia sp. N23]|uniref:carboxymuconolactone decarboxylase family protein n=1 Tax=Pseudonocardia sp. N23 TaxID=1987376 RepID=UPI000C032E2C|nr:carboxymuconolactone decarboxylase family protein [Pseudonocardia sp. N23]GAY07692.1 putative membrane protein [Pseudonocardia sp. N23]
MPLVPLLTADEFSTVDRPTLTAGVDAYGQVLNTWAAIGNSPGLFAAYLPFLKQVNGPGALEVRVKELAAVRVAVLNHCRYTASHRCTSALAKGVSLAELAAVAGGELDGFTERERIALVLAEEITLSVPLLSTDSSLTGVTPGLRDEAHRLFEPAELVELVMSISVWNALSRFHRVMLFDLDMPGAPEPVAALL